LQCGHQCLRERRAVAAGAGPPASHAGGEGDSKRHQLQRGHQRLREASTVAAGAGPFDLLQARLLPVMPHCTARGSAPGHLQICGSQHRGSDEQHHFRTKFRSTG
ncbi:unnamed protein product, partial [Polarella glacialis]